MKVEISKSFEKDAGKVSDKKLASKLLTIINNFENYKTLSEIPNLKKLQHSGQYYRIKIGGYRLGVKLTEDTLIIMRFLDRKDIYKYFP
jgi:mRNA interferase RelE/StbE